MSILGAFQACDVKYLAERINAVLKEESEEQSLDLVKKEKLKNIAESIKKLQRYNEVVNPSSKFDSLRTAGMVSDYLTEFINAVEGL